MFQPFISILLQLKLEKKDIFRLLFSSVEFVFTIPSLKRIGVCGFFGRFIIIKREIDNLFKFVPNDPE